ncbi:MAG: phosphotriesterase-related protein [Anaerolineae bacterium]|jgi:phosphotriesterase-related protein|nr:phosphotriesterase-related protein [Anaerolineae bacterium]
MPVIRTVCGDIAPDRLGFTYLHEHLIGGALKPGSDPDLTLDQPEAAAAELRVFAAAGGGALVEMSPVDYGRNPLALRRLSEATGVHIITVTGFIKGTSMEPFVADRSLNQIADRMIAEVLEGIDATGIRAGVIKAGSSKDSITPTEEKVLRAAARAHRETGAPISTHTEAGTMALEQIALLRSEGVPPERMLIGHLDRRLDWEYHLAVARTGAHFGYDQFGKTKYAPDATRVDFVARLVQAGFRDQLALSGDLARRSNFPAYGFPDAPGYAHLIQRVVPLLHQAGLSQADVDALFITTPARLLAFGD